MSDPAVQAAAARHFDAISEAMRAAHTAHPGSPPLDTLHDALNALMADAADLGVITITSAARDGHKPGPETPPEVPTTPEP